MHYGQTTLKGLFYFVRHGKSIFNSGKERYSGITDCDLTEKGIEQARATGLYFKDEKIQSIYTSPMKRAVATAEQIQSFTAAKIHTDPRLREISYGEWEGLTRNEIHRNRYDEYAAYEKDPVRNLPPGGESPRQVLKQVKSFWKYLCLLNKNHDLSPVVIVTHNTAVRILLGHLSGTSLGKYRQRKIDNCSITKISIDVEKNTIILFENYTKHLSGIP